MNGECGQYKYKVLPHAATGLEEGQLREGAVQVQVDVVHWALNGQ